MLTFKRVEEAQIQPPERVQLPGQEAVVDALEREQRFRAMTDMLLRTALDRCPSPSDGHWSAEASLLSRPVLERLGFKQVTVEHSVRNGVGLRRFRMRRDRQQEQHLRIYNV
jgi:hypothetical protein